MNTTSLLPSLQGYITELLPGVHGHRIKAITGYVSAIIDKQTGTQAELARSFGNQEAGPARGSVACSITNGSNRMIWPKR